MKAACAVTVGDDGAPNDNYVHYLRHFRLYDSDVGMQSALCS